MIITNIIGGLGNQMFQYACGRAVSLRMNMPLRLISDQFVEYSQHNGFELLSTFRISGQHATDDEVRKLLGWRAHPKLRRVFSRREMHWATGKNWCIEPHFNYWPGINEIHRSVYLHGYWQSEQYFKDVEEQIRKDFEFDTELDDKDMAVLEQMKKQPCASIHVRRGDYTTTKNKKVYAQCGVDYYKAALKLVQGKVPGVRIFVFSDDHDWVEANFRTELGEFDIVSHNIGIRSANDLRLMSNADHHVIANSSFSWWGAWLNPSPNKIVIAPNRWFVNGIDDRDLIPTGWIRI